MMKPLHRTNVARLPLRNKGKRNQVGLWFWMVLAGCSSEAEMDPAIALTIEGTEFRAWVADEPQTRALGLQGRSLADGEALLLAWPVELSGIGLWNVGVAQALDGLCLGADRAVCGMLLGIEADSSEVRPCDCLTQYVVEVPAGTAQTVGISEGTPCFFELLRTPL